MKHFLAATAIALALGLAAGETAQAGHKTRIYYYAASPGYSISPPIIVYDPAFLLPPPVIVRRPAYTSWPVQPPVYSTPVSVPRTLYYRPVYRPYRKVEIKYKRRPWGYKIEYDYAD